MTCTCKYATADNTEAVRKGFEMGGYVLEVCAECKAATSRQPSAALDEYNRPTYWHDHFRLPPWNQRFRPLYLATNLPPSAWKPES